jgi:hypothetical protein
MNKFYKGKLSFVKLLPFFLCKLENVASGSFEAEISVEILMFKTEYTRMLWKTSKVSTIIQLYMHKKKKKLTIFNVFFTPKIAKNAG